MRFALKKTKQIYTELFLSSALATLECNLAASSEVENRDNLDDPATALQETYPRTAALELVGTRSP